MQVAFSLLTLVHKTQSETLAVLVGSVLYHCGGSRQFWSSSYAVKPPDVEV